MSLSIRCSLRTIGLLLLAIRWRSAALIVASFLMIPWAGCSLAIREKARSTLPAKLKINWFYAEGSCGQLLGYVGAFAFGLNHSTLDQLRRDGLNFLQTTGGPADRAEDPIFNGVWKSTPLPALHFEDWPRSPGKLIQCGEQHSWLWPKGIAAALTESGSYYQTKGRRALYVIPELGIVVGAVSDK